MAYHATYPTAPNLTIHSEMRREMLEVVFVVRGSFAVVQKLQLKHVLHRTKRSIRAKAVCQVENIRIIKQPGTGALHLGKGSQNVCGRTRPSVPLLSVGGCSRNTLGARFPHQHVHKNMLRVGRNSTEETPVSLYMPKNAQRRETSPP